MKCKEESDILLNSCSSFGGVCVHQICQSCFRKENTDLDTSLPRTFSCPCCHILFYKDMLSIDEAILIGEAVTIRAHVFPQLSSTADVEISIENITSINEMNRMLIEKLESALLLNPSNMYTLYLLYRSCCYAHRFLLAHEPRHDFIVLYGLKLCDYAYKLIDVSTLPNGYANIKTDIHHELSCVFHVNRNHPAALKYAKLAYELCLRSSDHRHLSSYKDVYINLRAAFAKLPPLRFAVGDEVEFLHELGTGSEWKLGKIVELYHRERDFAITFTAPYRLQLLEDSDSSDEPPVYAWVKADLDRYVRKVGVRSIEDTRYQARLNIKVAELARVYFAVDFMQDVYRTLVQDLDFVAMLQSVWQIELSVSMLVSYRMLIMHRKPLVRTESGYHVPSSEEVIAGIRAYFDPSYLSGNAASSAAGEGRYTQWIISVLKGAPIDATGAIDASDVQGLLMHSIRNHFWVLIRSDPPSSLGSTPRPLDGSRNFSVPMEISEGIARASTTRDLRALQVDPTSISKQEYLLNAWVAVHECLENPDAEAACECPFVYFFIEFWLKQGWGVPKLALALYDRMNMQLSREFIRCANPTCELNRLDQSTGQVKFKLCSRCKTVIYCSRECQTAHYPEHKLLCREHSTG